MNSTISAVLLIVFGILMIIIEISRWKLFNRQIDFLEKMKNKCKKVTIDEFLGYGIQTRGMNQYNIEMYQCQTHNKYFAVKDNKLYEIQNVGDVIPYCMDKNIKSIETCQLLRNKYDFVGKVK